MEAMDDGLRRLEYGVKEVLNMDVLAGGPHIVKIQDIEFIETKRWSEIRIYSDLYPGGDMEKLIGSCARRRYVTPLDTRIHPGNAFVLYVLSVVNPTAFLTHCRVNIPEKAVINIACQVAEAISFCHARGFWHRDLKPANSEDIRSWH